MLISKSGGYVFPLWFSCLELEKNNLSASFELLLTTVFAKCHLCSNYNTRLTQQLPEHCTTGFPVNLASMYWVCAQFTVFPQSIALLGQQEKQNNSWTQPFQVFVNSSILRIDLRIVCLLKPKESGWSGECIFQVITYKKMWFEAHPLSVQQQVKTSRY